MTLSTVAEGPPNQSFPRLRPQLSMLGGEHHPCRRLHALCPPHPLPEAASLAAGRVQSQSDRGKVVAILCPRATRCGQAGSHTWHLRGRAALKKPAPQTKARCRKQDLQAGGLVPPSRMDTVT